MSGSVVPELDVIDFGKGCEEVAENGEFEVKGCWMVVGVGWVMAFSENEPVI